MREIPYGDCVDLILPPSLRFRLLADSSVAHFPSQQYGEQETTLISSLRPDAWTQQ
jgi:hypothetical protein